MIVDLRAFEDFPAQTTVKAGPGEITPVADSVKAVKSVIVDLAIQKAGEEFFCQGQVRADVTLECVRCLKEFDAQLRNKTDFVMCSETVVEERRREAIDDEDYVFLRGGDLVGDITEPVRQAIELALPMKTLCTPDCRGLCPSCGVNRNEETCDCQIDQADPRWEGLKGLFPEK